MRRDGLWAAEPRRLRVSLELLDQLARRRGEAQAHEQRGIADDLPVRAGDRARVVAREELHETVGDEVLRLARLLQAVHDRLLVLAELERGVLLSRDRVAERILGGRRGARGGAAGERRGCDQGTVGEAAQVLATPAPRPYARAGWPSWWSAVRDQQCIFPLTVTVPWPAGSVLGMTTLENEALRGVTVSLPLPWKT